MVIHDHHAIISFGETSALTTLHRRAHLA